LKLETTNKGNVLICEEHELKCKYCGTKKTPLDNEFWYFYDNKFDKGLYCVHCAKGSTNISIDKNKQNYFWLIHSFKVVN